MTACILATIAFACAWFAVFLTDTDRPFCWLDRIPWLHPVVCVLGLGCFEVLLARAVGAGGVALLLFGDVALVGGWAIGLLGLQFAGPETRARMVWGAIGAVLLIAGLPAVLAACIWLVAT